MKSNKRALKRGVDLALKKLAAGNKDTALTKAHNYVFRFFFFSAGKSASRVKKSGQHVSSGSQVSNSGQRPTGQVSTSDRDQQARPIRSASQVSEWTKTENHAVTSSLSRKHSCLLSILIVCSLQRLPFLSLFLSFIYSHCLFSSKVTISLSLPWHMV